VCYSDLSIKKNANVDKTVNVGKQTLFHARPLKIYRREIATITDLSHCAPRTSVRINEFDMPNGTIIHVSDNVQHNGLVNPLDINLTSNTSERPGTCAETCVLSQADNAKRRVRSSGMIKRKYASDKNNDTYYTSSNQIRILYIILHFF
jgi:hypothetical protein